MAEELTREEVSERLEAIFSASLEGKELDKAIVSIEKRLDKFEGKWAGLIKWAEQKYGLPEESKAVEEESEEGPEPETSADSQEETSEEPQEINENLSREEASNRLEAIFRSHLDGKELEKMVGSIEKRLDKFEGKWPKLIIWAEEKYGTATQEATSPEGGEEKQDETPSTGIEETLEQIIGGNYEEALQNLKALVSQNPSDPDVWNAFSSYYSSIGFVGRANVCGEKAESLA